MSPNKLFKKFKKSKLHIDKEIYKIARYEVQKLISYKKKKYFENRLNDSIGKPKELWKAVKSLGLPSKTSVCGTTALKVKNTTSFERWFSGRFLKDDSRVLPKPISEPISESESGFRKNHSTDSCLTFLHDKILKGFDKGLMAGMILLDLQKAFDTIDHDILLKKLSAIGWLKSYRANRLFRVDLGSCYSDPSNIRCGVPQGSILGPLLFLIYVNDMPQGVKSNLFLYADDSCLVFQVKNVIETEKQLNGDFTNICEWFVDNRLSIHFGEDKTKSILFAFKRKIKKVPKLKINYKNTQIKQHSKVTYLGCRLDEAMSGEPLALKVINKINSRLKFLHRKNKFLTPALRRLLCNALIQPHFDYVSSAWYLNLTQTLKNKIQITQNKCIRYCL